MRDIIQRINRHFLPAILLASLFPLGSLAETTPTVAATLNIGSAGSQLPDDDTLRLTLEGYFPAPVTPGPAWNDLLGELRQGFALDPVMNARVEAELKWYLRHPDYLQRVFNRSQRYLPHIATQLNERNLPLELALLPIVESAYDPFAYSHGRAAGLWQIIPGTGKRFGLAQNWWYDGRRDIVDSTRAALDYLTVLHKMMDGDWLLAVASYNSGEGNVLRAVKRNRSQSKPTDFWNLKLSRETSAYVPRLMALVAIVSDPAAYGVTLPTVVNDTQFAVVDIEGQLDLALAAELAGIDLNALYGFNAGLNRWATDPAGPHRLVMPAGVADSFEAALAKVPADERVRWKRHKVRNGETISEIAENYSTTLKAIRAANSLRGNTIRAGSYLMIPVATQPLTAYVKSADARRDKIQSKQRSGNRVDHVVRAGESFWSIGQHYGVGTRELAAWNATAPRDTLSVGQTLVVWTDKPSPASAANGNSLTRKLRYTVRSGDSLSRIATRFRIRVADLVRWNSIDTSKILRPGQTLTMYVDVTRQSS
jgi:membrane-bound lytic murein transglycosylase D